MASPKSTLPNDEKEAQDSAYNPGEQHARELNGGHDSIPGYDRSNDGLDDHPVSAGDSSGVEPPDSAAAIRDAEDEGGNWKSAYGGNKSKGGRTVTPMNVRAILKKRGPLGLIALLGLGGGLVGTVLFSPGLLLVQMKEALVNRMDTQLTSMDARTTKLLGMKVKGLTSGVCGAKISVLCRYSTMSDTQVKAFKDAGIDVNSTKTNILGRTKPDSFSFNNKQIDASNFTSEFNSNPEFRSALNKGYNPKFSGFTDSVWTKIAGKLGINKTKALPEGDDPAAKEKALQDQTKNGAELKVPADDGVTCDNSGCKDKNGTPLSDADAAKARALKNSTAAAAAEATQEATQQAAKEIGSVTQTGFKQIASFLNVTGAADDACNVYSSVRALGYAAKTVRAVQLAHYAMVFLNAADQIKAGTFSSADGAYLGGILTNVTYDAASGAKRKAAMDSFGMQYALYGFGGKSDSYVSQFMAGGGLTGNLIAVTDYINAVLGSSPLSACKFYANPAVQFGSIAAGIGLMLIPGVNVGAISAKVIIKGVSAVAVQIGLMVLPDLLKDIVAGNALNGIVGEDAGNAIASGSGKIMSDLAAGGGNGLMSVNDAVAYSQAQDATVAQYSAVDRLTANPLDATDSNTFLGSMVGKILPYAFNLGDIGGSITNIGSFVGSSLGSIIPQSSALSTEELRQSYTSCTDTDYQSMGIATDPMCNPIYGIPTQYMNIDPGTVVNDLVNSGQIDGSTGAPIPSTEPTSYAYYVTNCVNRTTPIGDVGTSFDQDPGTACIINNQQTAEYSLFTVDQRVQNGMDGVSTDPSAQNTTSAYEFYAPTDASSSVAANTQSQNQYTAVNAPSVAAAVPMKALAAQFTIADCLTSDKTSTVAPLSYKVGYGIV